MPINVGDAVLTFVGDTTQLDQAFAKVETDAQVKVSPATAKVEQLGEAWTFAGAEALKAGESAAIAGEETQAAAEKMTFSMTEAKGTMALAGEEMGVKIPRHLRTFIAELPGVGAAMEAAFSAVALFVLIDVIVQATKKLTEFISTTLIYTEAMKEEYAAQVAVNTAIADQVAKLKALKEAYALIGVEGSAKTKVEFDRLTESVNQNQHAMMVAENQLARYRDGIISLTEGEIGDLNRQIGLLNATINEQQQQQANLSKQYDREILEERIKHGESIVAAQKTLGDAALAVLQAQSALRLSHLKVAYLQEAQLAAAGEEQKYQIQLKALEQTRNLLALDPTSNADRIRQTNAQIEALEQEHLAKSLTAQAKYWSTLREVTTGGVQTVSSAITEMIPLREETAQMDQLQALLKQFGITSAYAWQEEINGAQAAYDEAVKLGAKYNELIQIKEKLVSAKLGKAIEDGDTAAAKKEAKALADTRQEMEKLGLSIDKTRTKSHQLFNEWSAGIPRSKNLWKDLGGMADATFREFTVGMESAIASSLLGQETIGQAMAQMVASVLAGVSAQAAVLSLFYLAKGFGYEADFMYLPAENAFQAAAIFGGVAVAAGAAAWGISQSTKSSNGTSDTTQQGPTPTGQAATGGPTGPTTGVNVQHFAKGGLVMSPTLAVIGDAINGAASSGAGQREAAIPLDDPEATGAIADAIGGRGGTTNHYHIQGVISSDMMDKVIDKINERTGSGKVLIATKARRVEKK